jgi:hypothetical protein
MKFIANSPVTRRLGGLIVLLSAVTSLTACSSLSSPREASYQSTLAIQSEDLEKLKSAEYQDDLSAMEFEDTNRRLGSYYAAKGLQAHGLIDQIDQGHQLNDMQIRQALDNSDSAKYDERPPVPLDDMTGTGY